MERVIACEDLFVEGVGILVFKRQVSVEHSKENDATGPDIDFDAVVPFALNHFRGGIAWRTTRSFEQFTFFVGVTEPKIYNFERIVIGKENVLGFEISVGDVDFPDVLNTVDEFVKKLSGFVFLNAFVFDNVVKEFTVFHVLHDQHQLLRRLDDLIELD
jgi:hypothetical protein